MHGSHDTIASLIVMMLAAVATFVALGPIV